MPEALTDPSLRSETVEKKCGRMWQSAQQRERASEKKVYNKVFAQAGCMTGVFPLKLNTVIIIMSQLKIMHNSSSMHPVLSLGLCSSQAQSKPHTAKHRPSRFCHCILIRSGQNTTRVCLPHIGSQNKNVF